MKTKKRFAICGRFKRHKILGFCFILVALFALTTHAQEQIGEQIPVNPGSIGGPANNLIFGVESPTWLVDLVFTDNKTLKWGAGTHGFILFGVPGAPYMGILLDENLDPIPGTEFKGEQPSDSDFGAGIVNLTEPTAFSGMRFFSGFEPDVGQGLNWDPDSDVPTVGELGEPVTIGGNVRGLEGSGLVLQNNDGDDLPIDINGGFTFDTPVEPGSTYNVTVLTYPSDPRQVCKVENGSGDVPNISVTNVAVTCVDPDLIFLIKVAAEGDTLADDTVLKNILLDGGVGINFDGQVAFGGRDGNGNDAVFTQGGRVVKEDDTLDDGNILAEFRGQGEVAINASLSQSGGKVAFHGQAEAGKKDTAAVFTQAGKVAAVGDILSDGITVNDIDPQGKVAINNFDQVTFHGSVEIEDGLYDDHFRVVFIADGVETWVAAQEGSNLPDGDPLDAITESGGVAINDIDEVAFHGQSGAFKAVFTQKGVVAKMGTDLPDGTLLDDINEDGGVAINLMSEVAFHGQTGSVKAVFISDGQTTQVVARVGDTLPDGNTLNDIDVSGGVAINLYGEVAFHGQTGGVKAVFTQNGVVAKVGDIVDDGNTLDEISSSAGVAINPYDRQLAFHGRIGSVDTVFVSLTPTPNAKPVADFIYTTDNLSVDFSDLSRDLDGEVVAWSWNFGDGSTSAEQNPSHTYAEAGTYTVSLTVTDDRNADSEEAAESVEVTAP